MDRREYRKSINGDTIVILFPDAKKIRKAGVKTSLSGEQYIFCDINNYRNEDLPFINKKYPLTASMEEYESMIFRINQHLKQEINAYSENYR